MAKTKNLLNKEKLLPLPISKFIDTKFRDYAIYVTESRGIPGYYDALTPVQRYILKNSPTSFQKTLTVVGKVIAGGYHHGNCLFGDTLINLGGGSQITIENWFKYAPNAELIVKCKNEDDEPILSIGHSPRVGQTTNEYYEIELENGEIIKCTANHPFFVDGKWVEAKDLNEDSELFTIT